MQPEILLIPLGGHTRGHAGVAVGRATGGCCTRATRTSTTGSSRRTDPRPHPLLDIVQLDSQVDAELRIANQARLRELPQDVTVISAHDPWELARYLDRPPRRRSSVAVGPRVLAGLGLIGSPGRPSFQARRVPRFSGV